MPDRPADLEEWGRLLRHEWEERSASPCRDFFIASHPGWDDPARWREEAIVSASMVMHGLDPEVLRHSDVLEIGCGVGRLTPHLAGRVRSYTGCDIAPSIVEEARRRCADLSNARFLPSDGLSVPAEARDRGYGLIFALAVFIHCPREVIASLVQDAYRLLAPGGILRMQVLADPTDPTGVVSLAAAETIHRQAEVAERMDVDRTLIDERHYKGAVFGYEDFRRFLAGHTAGDVNLMRVDLLLIYAEVRRPDAPAAA